MPLPDAADSMVCSEFAAHGWKTGFAQAFPVWNEIQAGEQTPKDNYQMALYDSESRGRRRGQVDGRVRAA